ncbi:hypothetical protein B0J14DRAFT_203950 [Halenospora varia]|nr:hypothetical protein B0J14DRAFT_203950 [Halenospora varia]
MSEGPCLVIAIDYGTTFTGFSFTTPKTANGDLDEIRVVTNFGDGFRMGNTDKVPSVISYSPKTGGEQQFGFSLSEEAVRMQHSKLELDVQETKLDELELILQVMDGMKDLAFEHVKTAAATPGYSWKVPEEIVKDYLERCFPYVEKAIAEDLGEENMHRLPVDIVMTVPVSWSYRAKDATLRAIQKAGFNKTRFPLLRDVMMVTEPEAAAVYTARFLKKEMGANFLKIGECFVLCDAGGGTVDVVSYKVVQLEPTIALEEVGCPTGAKCGSSYIDGYFKMWLRKLLGERNYRKLDPTAVGGKSNNNSSEGPHMRAIMDTFDGHKKEFRSDGRDIKLDLTEPSLANITIDGKVDEGQITIKSSDMKSFFDPCIDRILELVQGQVDQIGGTGYRVKNIFLVGGFGESEFLQDELIESLGMNDLNLRRPSTSWTAVVRGAAILGVEKAAHENITFLKTCPRSYGIKLDSAYTKTKHDAKDHYTDTLTNDVMAKGQMHWLIRKGDLILSDEQKVTEKELAFNFKETGKKMFKIPIYMYEDDDIPERYQNARNELLEVGVLDCDLSHFAIRDFHRFENPETGFPYYSAHCTVKTTLSEGYLTVQIMWNNAQNDEVELCKLELDHE